MPALMKTAKRSHYLGRSISDNPFSIATRFYFAITRKRENRIAGKKMYDLTSSRVREINYIFIVEDY